MSALNVTINGSYRIRVLHLTLRYSFSMSLLYTSKLYTSVIKLVSLCKDKCVDFEKIFYDNNISPDSTADLIVFQLIVTVLVPSQHHCWPQQAAVLGEKALKNNCTLPVQHEQTEGQSKKLAGEHSGPFNN